jgi:molybdopterin-guanine dinucleotide biosynthesis protein A
VKFSCIALAGGKSTRLGRNKLDEVIGGRRVFQHVLDTLSSFDTEIIMVVSQQSVLPPMEQYPLVRVIKDIYPGSGSLGGIFTGLLASNQHYNLVVACDMPFLRIDLLHYMINISKGYDLVAYNPDNRPEPLHAIYSRNCLVPMKSLLEQNKLRIIGILPHIKTRYITLEEIEGFDPEHLSFFNINNEDDLNKAREIEEALSLKT